MRNRKERKNKWITSASTLTLIELVARMLSETRCCVFVLFFCFIGVTDSMRENVCLGKFHLFEPTYFAAMKKTMHAYVVYFAPLKLQPDHSSIRTLQTFYHLRQSLWNWRAHQKKKSERVMHASDNLYLTDFVSLAAAAAAAVINTVCRHFVLSHSANYLECCHGSCFSMFCESALFFLFFPSCWTNTECQQVFSFWPKALNYILLSGSFPFFLQLIKKNTANGRNKRNPREKRFYLSWL